MGRLTTHVLDTSAGIPAAGIRIELHDLKDDAPRLLANAVTGPDGRCAAALLEGPAMRSGRFTLTFYVAEYFRSRGVVLPEPEFIDQAVVRIGIARPDEHYHVPLLISPWSYAVYRGG
ncbi:MAG TPA: hydroxyisourate hydrolase [Steroidobacteraceae bacterium]